MFRRYRIGIRREAVILFINEYILAYKIKLEREADYYEALLCNIVTGNSTLTVGLVYRSPNIISEEDNTKSYKGRE